MSVPESDRVLSRTEASQAVESIGWRYLLGTLSVSVPVSSFDQALGVATAAVHAAGSGADAHLRVDLRPERAELSVQTRATGVVTSHDANLAHQISVALANLDLQVAQARAERYPRPVAMLELALDAMDIPAVRPFWKAALAFVDDPADPGPTGALVDPAGQQPALWFQQMDEPRPQRNRFHLDITVAHDEAEPRVQAALDAGGHMVNDSYARMFWVLADAEGNECCICTWSDRDEWDATPRDTETLVPSPG
jgi:4a-hydroxytetrahydrobiopterin dehydratase